MKPISVPVSQLRLEAYLGQIVLKVGVQGIGLSDYARNLLLRHLAGQRVALFLMTLPPTLVCQNGNYLLANYKANTLAKLETKECSSKIITSIRFSEPETEEDFNATREDARSSRNDRAR